MYNTDNPKKKERVYWNGSISSNPGKRIKNTNRIYEVNTE